MTTKEVSQTIAATGFSYAYYQFPEGTETATPFICFYYGPSNDSRADNKNYQKIERLIIELYTDTKDFSAEAIVEAKLAEAGLVWARNEQPIGSERLYEVIFETDVIITEENNNGQ